MSLIVDIGIPRDKFNNLYKEERGFLFPLKNDNTVVIKGADKGSVILHGTVKITKKKHISNCRTKRLIGGN